jgi:hypothetical protein
MPLGVYRISTPRQSGYQASIRRYFPYSAYGWSHTQARAAAHAAALEWCYAVRRLLDLDPRAAVHRMSSRKAYVASVSRYFNGGANGGGGEGGREEERVQRRAVRWRRQAVKRIEEAGL